MTSDESGTSDEYDRHRARHRSIAHRLHRRLRRTHDAHTGAERTAVRIVPGPDPLEPESVVSAFARLYRHLTDAPEDSTLEWILSTKGDSAGVEYAFRCPDSEIEAVTRIVREVFPNTYTFKYGEDPVDEILDYIDFDDQEEPDSSVEQGVSSADQRVHGVRFEGDPVRRRDWQTSLTPFSEFRTDDRTRLPLSGIVETLAGYPSPALYQVVLDPIPDWSAKAASRRLDLEVGEDSLAQTAVSYLGGWGEPSREDSPRRGEGGSSELDSTSHEYRHLGESVRRRLDHLAQVDPKSCFDASVRAIVITERGGDESKRDATGVCTEFADAFAPIEGPYYGIRHTLVSGAAARDLSAAVRSGDPTIQSLRDRLRGARCLVVDPREAPTLGLLDGTSLTEDGYRALAVTPAEQAPRSPPPTNQLTPYRSTGMTLGTPLDQDDIAEPDPISLPPSLQPLHVGWVGKTGSGKSTGLVNAILENQAATAGADILIDPKGDGMPLEYLRAHYATHGTLENVYYFDCAETLPALSFFDIRPELADGLDRDQVVQNLVDHYIELLVAIMGRERFEQATRSPDIIRYLVKSLFDPIHGYDAIGHRMIQYAARRLHETRDAPSVSDPDLEARLGGIAATSSRSFDELMQGVANRIEKATRDTRLRRLLNHVPGRPVDAGVDGTADDPAFDFIELLDRDCVVLFDTGGLRTESQRILTLVLLSNLWTALHRREHRRKSAALEANAPLVNLYVEEAASVATSGLMTDLLAQSRGFGLSVTLAMQFPGQLRQSDAGAYAELLNNVSTLVTGNVSVDRDLAERLATDELDAEAVGTRLRSLRRGQWLVDLPAPFGTSEPRPFLVESAPLPAGHPDGDEPLSELHVETFEALTTACADRTRMELGLASSPEESSSGETRRDGESDTADSSTGRVDSPLPYTKRFPEYVTYDADVHSILCDHCDSRHPPMLAGMRSALDCCGTLERVDRDAIPVCDLQVTLTRSEQDATGYTSRQLLFLQAVYRAHQRKFDPELEYDILRDSMLRLREYTGVDDDAVDELLDDGVLSHDGNHPHKLYTVTPAGRRVLQVPHRAGVAYGDGQGDLSESSLHVLMVETGRRHIERTYVDDPDSLVVDAVSYHEVDGYRLDAAGLDANGDVVIAVEAERSNHDTREGVPADFDKMALLNPEEAIWIVPNREVGHEVLHALNDPLSGPTRVETEYSESVPPQRFDLDTAGCTGILTVATISKLSQ